MKDKIQKIMELVSHIERYTQPEFGQYTWMTELASNEIRKDLNSIRNECQWFVEIYNLGGR